VRCESAKNAATPIYNQERGGKTKGLRGSVEKERIESSLASAIKTSNPVRLERPQVIRGGGRRKASGGQNGKPLTILSPHKDGQNTQKREGRRGLDRCPLDSYHALPNPEEQLGQKREWGKGSGGKTAVMSAAP